MLPIDELKNLFNKIKPEEADKKKSKQGNWFKYFGWLGEPPRKFIPFATLLGEGYTGENVGLLVLPTPAYENPFTEILFVRDIGPKIYLIIARRKGELIWSLYTRKRILS